MKDNQRELPRRKYRVLKLWEFNNEYLETFANTTTFDWNFKLSIGCEINFFKLVI